MTTHAIVHSSILVVGGLLIALTPTLMRNTTLVVK